MIIRTLVFVLCWNLVAWIGHSVIGLESFPLIMAWGVVATVISACVSEEIK